MIFVLLAGFSFLKKILAILTFKCFYFFHFNKYYFNYIDSR
jgi:hypothetical protein